MIVTLTYPCSKQINTPCCQSLIKKGILNKISFRKRKNIFQKKLSTDIGELKKVKKIFVMGDKTKKKLWNES